MSTIELTLIGTCKVLSISLRSPTFTEVDDAGIRIANRIAVSAVIFLIFIILSPS
ncbi:MAG: hypothetical protein ACE5KE_08190 [Methanosarcinales archaeon]